MRLTGYDINCDEDHEGYGTQTAWRQGAVK